MPFRANQAVARRVCGRHASAMEEIESAAFYDELAAHYHLIYEDWEAAITSQAKALDALIQDQGIQPPADVLDCTCGVGTQALGLAALGYRVTGSDQSAPAVIRARSEAGWRGLDIALAVADVRNLADVFDNKFDVVLSVDNGLPHLASDEALMRAARAMVGRLKPDGLIMVSIRDYDTLVYERPVMEPPRFTGTGQHTRFVHQIWEWLDERRYRMHLYLTEARNGGWINRHFAGEYRAVLRLELGEMFQVAGIAHPRWLMPQDTGYHQPILVGRRA